jgi:hypothetical protein
MGNSCSSIECQQKQVLIPRQKSTKKKTAKKETKKPAKKETKKPAKKETVCKVLQKQLTLQSKDGKIINPLTLKKIDRNGETAKELRKGCKNVPKKTTKQFLEKQKVDAESNKVINPKSDRKIDTKKKTFKVLTS